MRKFTFLFYLIIISCQSQTDIDNTKKIVSDLVKSNLIGNISKVITLQGKDTLSIETFNDFGNLIDRKQYTTRNRVIYKSLFEYDEYNRITKMATDNLFSNTTIIKTYEYPIRNEIIQKTIWPDGSVFETYHTKFLKNGKLKSIKLIAKDGKRPWLNSIKTYEYPDKKTELIYTKTLSRNDKYLFQRNELDEFGNVIVKTTYYPDGKINDVFKNSFDSNNNKSNSENTNTYGKTEVHNESYIYDDNNNWIKKSYNLNRIIYYKK